MTWLVQDPQGRYLRFEPCGTILFATNIKMATPFEQTRDYMDGLCLGLKLGLEDTFTPVLLNNDQTTINAEERSRQANVDDVHAGN